MKQLGQLSLELKKSHKRLGNWRAVGAVYGVNFATLRDIAEEGYDPKDPGLRWKLGLPAIIPTLACAKCGKVHVKRRCTRGRENRTYRHLWEIPVEVLRRMLEERVEWVNGCETDKRMKEVEDGSVISER